MCANLSKICHFHAEMVNFELILTHLKFFWVKMGGGGQKYLGEIPQCPLWCCHREDKKSWESQNFSMKNMGSQIFRKLFQWYSRIPLCVSLTISSWMGSYCRGYSIYFKENGNLVTGRSLNPTVLQGWGRVSCWTISNHYLTIVEYVKWNWEI